MKENSKSGSPLVSVIIPAYNAERFVERAVRSIMTQTYENLEILICDDCSEDRTFDILKKLAADDKRIVLLKNERNLQIVATLNKMVGLAKGEYIARMDADDISLPERIEMQLKFMEKNPDYGICGTYARFINEDNFVIGKSRVPHLNNDIQIFLNFDSPFVHPSVIIRAEILKANHYDKNYQYCEDFELWHRVLRVTKGYNLNTFLFCYRISKSSISHKTESAKVQKQLSETLSLNSNVRNIYKIKNTMAASRLYVQLIQRGKIKFSLFPFKNIIYTLAVIFYKISTIMRHKCREI